jgi:hypothetical protein
VFGGAAWGREGLSPWCLLVCLRMASCGGERKQQIYNLKLLPGLKSGGVLIPYVTGQSTAPLSPQPGIVRES